jgi:hypothetical protein
MKMTMAQSTLLLQETGFQDYNQALTLLITIYLSSEQDYSRSDQDQVKISRLQKYRKIIHILAHSFHFHPNYTPGLLHFDQKSVYYY